MRTISYSLSAQLCGFSLHLNPEASSLITETSHETKLYELGSITYSIHKDLTVITYQTVKIV